MGCAAKKVNRVSAHQRNQIDGADLEPFVQLQLPAIEGGEVSAPSMTIKVLTGLQRCRVVFVEATSEALTYLRAAAMQPSESRKRTCESLKTCADERST